VVPGDAKALRIHRPEHIHRFRVAFIRCQLKPFRGLGVILLNTQPGVVRGGDIIKAATDRGQPPWATTSSLRRILRNAMTHCIHEAHIHRPSLTGLAATVHLKASLS
jgi:hypothetical protein